MNKGIINVDADIVSEWFVAGKTRDDVKTLLKLPEQYQVDEVAMHVTGQHVVITVLSPDIPEVGNGIDLPEIQTHFSKIGDEQGQWHIPESYALTHLKAIVSLPIENASSSQQNIVEASQASDNITNNDLISQLQHYQSKVTDQVSDNIEQQQEDNEDDEGDIENNRSNI